VCMNKTCIAYSEHINIDIMYDISPYMTLQPQQYFWG